LVFIHGGVPTADRNWRPCPLWRELTPSHPPFPYVDLETRGFAVFLCFLVCILVKIDSIWFCLLCVWFLLIVNTSASDCLERIVPEIIYCVLRGTLNSTHSLTHFLSIYVFILIVFVFRKASSCVLVVKTMYCCLGHLPPPQIRKKKFFGQKSCKIREFC